MNALWRQRVRRACRALKEIRLESGGNVSISRQVGVVHGVVWGDV